eukprot:170373_1
MRGNCGLPLENVNLAFVVNLDTKTISGYAELTFLPHKKAKQPEDGSKQSTAHAREIPLNFAGARRAGVVRAVSVNGVRVAREKCGFKADVADSARPQSFSTVRDLENYDILYDEQLDILEEGEYVVCVPDEVISNLAADGRYVLRIDYVLEAPTVGLHFVGTNPLFPDRAPQLHSYNCAWFPSVDSLLVPCPFELSFTVSERFVVVASGELTGRCFADPLRSSEDGEKDAESSPRRVTYTYKTESLRSELIGFAVGAFEMKSQTENLLNFASPEKLNDMETSVTCVPRAMSIFEEYIHDEYPFKTYKQVFVDEAYKPAIAFGGLALISSDLLYSDEQIDQVYETREILALTLARSWCFSKIRIKYHCNMWIPLGFASFLCSLFLAEEFGRSLIDLRRAEARFPVGRPADQPPPLADRPLSWHGFGHPTELDWELLSRKALLVLLMLQPRLGESEFKEVVREMIKKNKIFTTRTFDRLVRKKVPNQDRALRHLFKLWVSGTAYPEYSCRYFFNRKRNEVDLVFNRISKPEGEQLALGDLQVSVQELEGRRTHKCKFVKQDDRFSLECTTRPPRISKKSRGAGSADYVDNGGVQSSTPVKWFRVDPDYQWIMRLHVYVDDPALLRSLLNEGGSVSAQIEALAALSLVPSGGGRILLEALQDDARAWPVRVAAARALSRCSRRTEAAELLWKFAQSLWYSGEGGHLLANDFNDFGAYYLQKEVPLIASTMRDENGISLPLVVSMILKMLRENDNAKNPFSDNVYLASLLRAMGLLTTAYNDPKRSEIWAQLHRYLNFDSVVHSYRRVVTQACLEAAATLERNRQFTSQSDMGINFQEYIQLYHPPAVRIAAFKAMADVSPENTNYLETMLASIENESNPGLQLSFARAWAESYTLTAHARAYVDRRGAMQNVSGGPLKRPVGFEALRPITGLMDRLWNLLTTSANFEVRHYIYRVYEHLWGRKAPACASDLQRSMTVVVPSGRARTFKRRAREKSNLAQFTQAKPPKRGLEVPTSFSKRQRISEAPVTII